MKSSLLLCLCLITPFNTFCSYGDKLESLSGYFGDCYDSQRTKTLIMIDLLKEASDPLEIMILKTNLKVEFLRALNNVNSDIERFDRYINSCEEEMKKPTTSEDRVNQYIVHIYHYMKSKEECFSELLKIESQMDSVLNSY